MLSMMRRRRFDDESHLGKENTAIVKVDKRDDKTSMRQRHNFKGSNWRVFSLSVDGKVTAL